MDIEITRLIVALLAMIFMFLALIFGLKVVRDRSGLLSKLDHKKRIKIKETCHFDARTYLTLVDVDDEEYILAVAPQGVQVVDKKQKKEKATHESV